MPTSIDPDLPVIIFATLGLLIAAPVVILFVLWFMKPVLRQIAKFERELAEPIPEERKRSRAKSSGWKRLFIGAAVCSVVIVVWGVVSSYVDFIPSYAAKHSYSSAFLTPPKYVDAIDPEGMSAPKIELDEASVQKAIAKQISKSTKGDEEIIEEKPRPAWMTDKPKANQAILVSDPYQSAAECRRGLDVQAVSWAIKKVGDQTGLGLDSLNDLGVVSNDLVERLNRSEYVEARETSVGPMVVTHRLVELNEHDANWLAEIAQQAQGRSASVKVALVGSGVLGMLAALYAALGYGEKPGEPRP